MVRWPGIAITTAPSNLVQMDCASTWRLPASTGNPYSAACAEQCARMNDRASSGVPVPNFLLICARWPSVMDDVMACAHS